MKTCKVRSGEEVEMLCGCNTEFDPSVMTSFYHEDEDEGQWDDTVVTDDPKVKKTCPDCDYWYFRRRPEVTP